jgi:hypothetical protein
MSELLFSICAWGVLSFIVIALACVFLYCLYLTAGFWVALGIFLLVVLIWRSEEKKIKALAAYKVEHRIDHDQGKTKGFHLTDFALGWIVSRLFK